MRKTFFNRLLKQNPNYVKDIYRVTFMDTLHGGEQNNTEWFIVTITKEEIGGYHLSITVQTQAFLPEHELSDNAIELTHPGLQERLKTAIDNFFNWDED